MYSLSAKLINDMPIMVNLVSKGENSYPLQIISVHGAILPFIK